MNNIYYAVYYGPILCVLPTQSYMTAIFITEESACTFAAYMCTISPGYHVRPIKVLPVRHKGRPRKTLN